MRLVVAAFAALMLLGARGIGPNGVPELGCFGCPIRGDVGPNAAELQDNQDGLRDGGRLEELVIVAAEVDHVEVDGREP